jgi:hypothetical protein
MDEVPICSQRGSHLLYVEGALERLCNEGSRSLSRKRRIGNSRYRIGQSVQSSGTFLIKE